MKRHGKTLLAFEALAEALRDKVQTAASEAYHCTGELPEEIDTKIVIWTAGGLVRIYARPLQNGSTIRLQSADSGAKLGQRSASSRLEPSHRAGPEQDGPPRR